MSRIYGIDKTDLRLSEDAKLAYSKYEFIILEESDGSYTVYKDSLAETDTLSTLCKGQDAAGVNALLESYIRT